MTAHDDRARDEQPAPAARETAVDELAEDVEILREFSGERVVKFSGEILVRLLAEYDERGRKLLVETAWREAAERERDAARAEVERLRAEQHEVRCPSCDATIRSRLVDQAERAEVERLRSELRRAVARRSRYERVAAENERLHRDRDERNDELLALRAESRSRSIEDGLLHARLYGALDWTAHAARGSDWGVSSSPTMNEMISQVGQLRRQVAALTGEHSGTCDDMAQCGRCAERAYLADLERQDTVAAAVEQAAAGVSGRTGAAQHRLKRALDELVRVRREGER